MKTCSVISQTTMTFLIFETERTSEELLEYLRDRKFSHSQRNMKRLLFAEDVLVEIDDEDISEQQKEFRRWEVIQTKEQEGYTYLGANRGEPTPPTSAIDTPNAPPELGQSYEGKIPMASEPLITTETQSLPTELSQPPLMGMALAVSVLMAIVGMFIGLIIIGAKMPYGANPMLDNIKFFAGIGVAMTSLAGIGITYGFVYLVRAVIDIRNVLVAQSQQPAEK